MSKSLAVVMTSVNDGSIPYEIIAGETQPSNGHRWYVVQFETSGRTVRQSCEVYQSEGSPYVAVVRFLGDGTVANMAEGLDDVAAVIHNVTRFGINP